jgi:hypothetical protein
MRGSQKQDENPEDAHHVGGSDNEEEVSTEPPEASGYFLILAATNRCQVRVRQGMCLCHVKPLVSKSGDGTRTSISTSVAWGRFRMHSFV